MPHLQHQLQPNQDQLPLPLVKVVISKLQKVLPFFSPDFGCDFEHDLCGFDIHGIEGFQFERKKGSDVDQFDHNGVDSTYFLYAEAVGVDEPVEVTSCEGTNGQVFFQVVTSIESPLIQGDASALQCFNFWFYIDGFFGGTKNETLLVIQESSLESVPDMELWRQQNATSGWTEVSLRSSFFKQS